MWVISVAEVTYWHKMEQMMGLHSLTLNYLAEPPLLAQGPATIGTGIGQSLTIPCMLLDGIPLPERYWSHNGKPVMWSLSHFITQIVVISVHAWQWFFLVGSSEWTDFPEEWWQSVYWKSCSRRCWNICLHRSKYCWLQKRHGQRGDSR